eukprot:2003647-Rhodomonas_salina.1
MTSLTDLNLSGFACVGAGVEIGVWLGQCSQLHVLKLRKLDLSAEALATVVSSLAACTRLHTLDVSNNLASELASQPQLREALVKALSMLPALRILDFSEANIRDTEAGIILTG